MICISRSEMEIIKDILRKHIKTGEVRAFGSRYRGGNSTFSDLDIAIKTGGVLGLKELTLICEAFEESELPFRVDVLDYNNISPAFRAVIDKGYEVIMRAL